MQKVALRLPVPISSPTGRVPNRFRRLEPPLNLTMLSHCNFRSASCEIGWLDTHRLVAAYSALRHTARTSLKAHSRLK